MKSALTSNSLTMAKQPVTTSQPDHVPSTFSLSSLGNELVYFQAQLPCLVLIFLCSAWWDLVTLLRILMAVHIRKSAFLQSILHLGNAVVGKFYRFGWYWPLWCISWNLAHQFFLISKVSLTLILKFVLLDKQSQFLR